MKNGCLTISLTTGLTLLILLIFFLVQISKCSNRSQFVIKNCSEYPVTVEFIYNSIDVETIVLGHIYDRILFENQYLYADTIANKIIIDSLRELELTNEYLRNFIKDSINAYTLIMMERSDKDSWEGSYPLIDFYPDDNTLLQKIFKENTISVALESNMFLKQSCKTCGDCTCFDAEFPYTMNVGGIPSNQFIEDYPMLIRIKVIHHNGQIVEITPENFQKVMKKKTIDGHENSVILEIR